MPMLLLLAAAGLFAAARGIPAATLFRDTTAVVNAPLYVGALSLVGLFLWAATAAICLFTAALLWRHPSRSPERTFFLGAGLLTAVLLLDDAFLFHESIAPDDLGISGSAVYAAYGTAVAGLFWAHRRAVWDSAYSILGGSLAFLAASIGIDLMVDYEFVLPALFVEAPGLEFYLEDGAKLFGIAGWGTYFAWTGYQRLTEGDRRFSPPPAGRGDEQQAPSSAVAAASNNGSSARPRPETP
ncbi:MAG: hypothetical protein ACLFTE_06065 [Salinivenus sp.]